MAETKNTTNKKSQETKELFNKKRRMHLIAAVCKASEAQITEQTRAGARSQVRMVPLLRERCDSRSQHSTQCQTP